MNELSNQFDRLPPHDVASEMCTIASAVLDGDACEEILSIVRPDDFFQADHGIMLTCIGDLRRDGRHIDPMTLRTELERRQLLEECGGVAYLAQIISSVPSAAHGASYAKRVAESARKRDLIRLSNEVLREMYAPHAEDDWQKTANKLIADVSKIITAGSGDSIRHISEVLMEALDRYGAPDTSRHIKTGLIDFDCNVGGLALGRMSVVGGRPGMGKSQFGKQLALNIGRGGIAVGIVSIEEDAAKIANNFYANLASVPNPVLCYGAPDAGQMAHLLTAMTTGSKYPIYLDDKCETLANVESSVTRLATKYGCKVVIVDYLQLIHPNDGREDKREGQVRLMSNTLKRVFKRLNVAGVVLAQLNRAAGREKPTLTNLRESGSIEQDGDLIVLLHREDYYLQQEPDFQPDYCLEANIAKNKDGPTPVIQLHFDGKFQRISDWNGGFGERTPF